MSDPKPYYAYRLHVLLGNAVTTMSFARLDDARKAREILMTARDTGLATTIVHLEGETTMYLTDLRAITLESRVIMDENYLKNLAYDRFIEERPRKLSRTWWGI